MQRGFAGGAVVAATRGLAVDGDELRGIAAQFARPGHEAIREQVRIEAVEKEIEPAGARHAMVIGQETAQEVEMGLAPGGDVVEVVAGSDAGADHQEQRFGPLLIANSSTSSLPKSIALCRRRRVARRGRKRSKDPHHVIQPSRVTERRWARNSGLQLARRDHERREIDRS